MWEELRHKDDFTTPHYAHMRGIDQTITDRPWTFFWAFITIGLGRGLAIDDRDRQDVGGLLQEHVDRLKATTACTLRLTRHWQSTSRIVVGDAWFGSVRTVEELLGIQGSPLSCASSKGRLGTPRTCCRHT